MFHFSNKRKNVLFWDHKNSFSLKHFKHYPVWKCKHPLVQITLRKRTHFFVTLQQQHQITRSSAIKVNDSTTREDTGEACWRRKSASAYCNPYLWGGNTITICICIMFSVVVRSHLLPFMKTLWSFYPRSLSQCISFPFCKISDCVFPFHHTANYRL